MKLTKKKILIILLLVILVVIASLTFWIYKRPLSNTCEKRDYFYTNSTYQDLLDTPFIRTCNQRDLHIENVLFVNTYTNGIDEAELDVAQLNQASEIQEQKIIKLPISLRSTNSGAIKNSSYSKLYMDFELTEFEYWKTSFTDLFNINYKPNVKLTNWKILELKQSEADESNLTISDSEKQLVAERSLDWLMTGGYQENQHPIPSLYLHNIEDGNFSIKIQASLDETLLKDSISQYARISMVWNMLKDRDIVNKSLDFIKTDYESISKNQGENSIPVDCYDVDTLIKNIKSCGSKCSNVLDTAFQNEIISLCESNNMYSKFVDKYNEKISLSKDQRTFTSISNISDVLDLNEKDSLDTKKYNIYEDKRFWQRSDFVKDFVYWLYVHDEGDNKVNIAYEAYDELLSYFKARNFNYYGICDVGNTALEIYKYTNDARLKSDAEYIYQYGEILETNTFPTGVKYMSGNVLRESLSCSSFLLNYSEIFDNKQAYSNAVAIFKDRMNRSWATPGYPGGFGYDDEYKGTKMENEIGGGFYDFLVTDSGHTYRYDFNNQSFILSLISRL